MQLDTSETLLLLHVRLQELIYFEFNSNSHRVGRGEHLRRICFLLLCVSSLFLRMDHERNTNSFNRVLDTYSLRTYGK